MEKYIKPTVEILPAEMDDILVASINNEYHEEDVQLSRRSSGVWYSVDDEQE